MSNTVSVAKPHILIFTWLTFEACRSKKLIIMRTIIIFVLLLLSGLYCKAQGYLSSDAERVMDYMMKKEAQKNASRDTYYRQQNNTVNDNYGSSGYNDTRSHSNGYNSNYNNNRSNNPVLDVISGFQQPERIIQGVFVSNNHLAVIRLRYFDSKITHYSLSRDNMNREQWQSIYPDYPHPTIYMIDGQLANEYKYKVSVSGTTVYFNM